MPLLKHLIGSDRRWLSPMAGESFYPHGRKYQVHSERRCRDRSCVVAPECIRSPSFPVATSRGMTSIRARFRK